MVYMQEVIRRLGFEGLLPSPPFKKKTYLTRVRYVLYVIGLLTGLACFRFTRLYYCT
jgi:hypothetical protein